MALIKKKDPQYLLWYRTITIAECLTKLKALHLILTTKEQADVNW